MGLQRLAAQFFILRIINCSSAKDKGEFCQTWSFIPVKAEQSCTWVLHPTGAFTLTKMPSSPIWVADWYIITLLKIWHILPLFQSISLTFPVFWDFIPESIGLGSCGRDLFFLVFQVVDIASHGMRCLARCLKINDVY